VINVDYLEKIFYMLMEENVLDTPEYQKATKLYNEQMENVRAAMGLERSEKVGAAFAEYDIMENQRFFLYGLRLGLELLRI